MGEDGVDRGPKTRPGFLATGRINRKDSAVNRNDDREGLVVSNELDLTLDAEAILESSS